MPESGSEEERRERRAVFKDRLAIAAVILALVVLLFMMVDGAVMNFQCSFRQFITFECNRWNAKFKPWSGAAPRPSSNLYSNIYVTK